MSERLTEEERAISVARRAPVFLETLPANLIGAKARLTVTQPYFANMIIFQPFSATLTAKE